MIDADQVHDDKIVDNVESMQKQADTAVAILREQLAKLHAIALGAVASAGKPSRVDWLWYRVEIRV
jgi:hypothetical protein